MRRGRPSTMRTRVGLAVLLLLLLAACGQQTRSPRAEDRQGVGGAYTADGLPEWGRGVDRLAMDLGRDELRFTAGCNQFSGPVTWEVNGHFEAGPLAGTEMGCEPAAMRADEALVDFFQRADHLTLDGNDISLRAGKEEIWFVPTSDQPWEQPAAVDLEGTPWRLTGIGEYSGDVGGMMSIPDSVSATLVLSSGDLQFGAGCNQGTGHYRIEGDELVLSDVGTTTLPCPVGRPGDLERGVLRVLGGGRVTWSITAKHLTLLTKDHRFQLDYEAQ